MSKPLDTCRRCDGAGYWFGHLTSNPAIMCPDCDGIGQVSEDEKLNFTNQARIILRALIHVYTKPEEDLLAVIEGRAKNSEIAPLDETGEIALKELIKLNGDSHR